MSKDIGVDLGTKNTLIYSKNKGVILNEPSVVAVHSKNGTVLAVGREAKEMIGKTPEHVVVVRPLSGGVIADFDVTRVMLKIFLDRACKGSLFRPRITVCVPSGITDVERRAVLEAVVRSGGKGVYVMEEPMAAAIGAGLPVSEAVGSMVVDIGGGTSEAAVVSFGGIVASDSIRYAGDRMDEDIRQYVKNKYGVLIGTQTAESLKIFIGAAHSACEEREMSVMGRDIATGLPKTVVITTAEVREAMSKTIGKILEAIKNTLENTPPELMQDIVSGGIALTGGGAKIPGLSALIEEATGIRAYLAENAEECVAIGAGAKLAGASRGGIFLKSRLLFQSRG